MSSSKPQRVLVLSLAGIGDTLMATPILHELRVQFPDAQIDVLVLWTGAAELLAGNPHVSRVWQHNFIRSGKLASLRFVTGLRRNRYDLSLTLHPQGRREYRFITRLIGAQRRLSHRYENHGWLDRLLVTDEVPQDYTVHCVENNLRLLEAAGWPRQLAEHTYELPLTREETSWARDTVKALGLVEANWLGVHVGSGGTKNLALRRWPLVHYESLFAALFRRDPETRIVLFGGPEETVSHDRLRMIFAPELAQQHLLIPATPSLRHAAALLAEAPRFLSVDTVFMHLAAAVRVPRQYVIETPTLNPPVEPKRPDWIRIPNPAVGNRHLDFYRYDGRPIAGTAEELTALMRSVTPERVLMAMAAPCPPASPLRGRIPTRSLPP